MFSKKKPTELWRVRYYGYNGIGNRDLTEGVFEMSFNVHGFCRLKSKDGVDIIISANDFVDAVKC